jgi:threonylcarbamoyladenosine tRNA methylthiotransferase MtaB
VSTPKSPAGRTSEKQEKRRTRAFVKIQQGCRNFCSYCIVPYVRNKESSVPADKVVALVNALVADGCREIVLTGTEIGDYNSNGIDLLQLMSRLLLETDAPRIRISSLQPHHVTRDFVALWQDPRLCPHFHLSLQSGSDAVLQRMKRKYTSAAYRNAVSLIRNIVPDAAITTDVIVGFPGETDAEFRETLDFCQAIKFAKIHVFPFSPRPGTSAAGMPNQVSDAVKKERTGRMLDQAKAYAREFHQSFIGQRMEVLWEQQAGGVWSGYTPNYIKVYLKSPGDLANTVTSVELLKLYRDGLWGESTP